VHTSGYSQKYVFQRKLLRQKFLPRRNCTPKFDTPDVCTPDSGTLTGALLVLETRCQFETGLILH